MAELDTRDEHSHTHVAVRDPYAEPSAEWGWHGTFPRTTVIGGWSVVAILVLLTIGNHIGNVENLWLLGSAATLAIMLIWSHARRRTSWRR